MTKEYVISSVDRIIKETGSRDPFSVCERYGIQLYYHDIGEKLKGYYYYNRRISNIVINSNIDNEWLILIVLSHELGHFALHKNSARLFQEIELQSPNPFEVEANYFGAELLLADKDTMDVIRDTGSLYHSSSILHVPDWFLKCKINMLITKGYDLPYMEVNSFSLRNSF